MSKKTRKEQLVYRKIKKPNRFIARIVLLVLGRLSRKKKVKITYKYDKKQLKKQPVILLATHTSRLEFIYTLHGFNSTNINIVCGYQNILVQSKLVFKLMLKLGVIAKYLYQSDVVSVKQMIRAIKNNTSLVIFPEGIQSVSGSTQPINPATIKLLKKCTVPVVLSKSYGSYLVNNRYSSDTKKGPIEVEFSLLFTKEDLANLSEQEIYNKLLEQFKYNEFEYNKLHQHKYIGKTPNIEGLNKLIYICPHCKQEFKLVINNDNMKCTNCEYEIKMNECYNLLPVNKELIFDDIDKWYKWQRNIVREEVKDDSFELSMEATLQTFSDTKFIKKTRNLIDLSSGKVVMNNKGIKYYPTDDEKNPVIFDAKGVYSLTLSTRGYLEFYYYNDYYIFKPNNPTNELVKWMLAAEEIHIMYDDAWEKVSQDVYKYETNEKEAK